MSHIKYYWEDFAAGDTREFGGRTISEADILNFAKEYDPQVFHIDAKAAEQTIFKGLIASGWQTCAFMMRMICDEYLLESSSQGSPGLDSLKWLKPVRPGDRIRVRSKILETRAMKSNPKLGLVSTLWECLNQNDEVVTVMQGSLILIKRNSD
jgi:acyl dehydratase